MPTDVLHVLMGNLHLYPSGVSALTCQDIACGFVAVLHEGQFLLEASKFLPIVKTA